MALSQLRCPGQNHAASLGAGNLAGEAPEAQGASQFPAQEPPALPLACVYFVSQYSLWLTPLTSGEESKAQRGQRNLPKGGNRWRGIQAQLSRNRMVVTTLRHYLALLLDVEILQTVPPQAVPSLVPPPSLLLSPPTSLLTTTKLPWPALSMPCRVVSA